MILYLSGVNGKSLKASITSNTLFIILDESIEIFFPICQFGCFIASFGFIFLKSFNGFFKNGQTKFLYHETDMLIPIANAIYENKIDIETLSGKKNSFPKNCQSLKFQEIDKKKFPIVTLLSKNIFQNSGPIILNASNEVLVDSFIKGKITFNSIYLYLRAVFRDKDFGKYAIKKAPNVKEIYRIDKWARRKTLEKINEKKNI